MIPSLMRRRFPGAVPSLLCSVLLSAQALAQPVPAVRRADPFDPKAAVPALRYESALAQYRRLSDEKTVSWRGANDAVARIGGWRVYAREAQQADPPDPAPTPATVPAPPATKSASSMPADMPHKSMPAGHSGHKQP